MNAAFSVKQVAQETSSATTPAEPSTATTTAAAATTTAATASSISTTTKKALLGGPGPHCGGEYTEEMLELHNRYREAHGAPKLKISKKVFF